MHQILCRLGLRPRPHWGAYSVPPKSLAGFKGPTLKRKWERTGKGGEGKEGEKKGKRRGGEKEGEGKGKGRGKGRGDKGGEGKGGGEGRESGKGREVVLPAHF